MKRRIYRLLIWGFFLTFTAFLSTPYWLGYILHLFLDKDTVHYKSFHNEGITQFYLEDLQVKYENLQISIDTLTLPSPFYWILGKINPLFAIPIKAQGVLIQEESHSTTNTLKTVSQLNQACVYEILKNTLDSLKLIDKWLPEISIKNLTYTDQVHFNILFWNDTDIIGQGKLPSQQEPFRFNIQAFIEEQTLKGILILQKTNALFNGTIQLTDTGVELNTYIHWMQNTAKGIALWDTQACIPHKATFNFKNWQLPKEWFQLQNYQQPALDGTVQWSKDSFIIDTTLFAKASDHTKHPDLSADIDIKFNDSQLSINTLKINTPWFLSNKQESASSEKTTTLNLNIDLNTIPILKTKAQGNLLGSFVINNNYEDYPQLTLNLLGENIRYEFQKIPYSKLNAHFKWPEIYLRNCEIQTEDLGKLQVTTQSNLISREHTGELTLHNKDTENLLAGTTLLTWQGKANTLTHFELKSTTDKGHHLLSGQASFSETTSEFNFQTWDILINKETPLELHLKEPFTTTFTLEGYPLSIAPFQFKSHTAATEINGSFNMDQEGSGSIQCALKELPVAFFSTPLKQKKSLENLTINTFNTQADINNKIPTGTLTTTFTHSIIQNKKLSGNLDLSANTTNLFAKSNITLNDQQPILDLDLSLPINKDFWAAIYSNNLPDCSQLGGSTQANELPIEEFSAFIPDLARPQGILSISAQLTPNQPWRGNLTLKDLATFPIHPIGPINNIQVNITFNETKAEIEDFSGTIGNQPVTLCGQINYLNPKNLKLDLCLDGDEVPVIRSPGLILKADLHLKAKTDTQSKTKVFGDITLKDGLAILSFGDFKSSMGTPSSPPPYFSIDDPWVKEWTLDVKVKGNSFLNLDTQFFKSSVSANINLQGTLEHPIALGTISLEDGFIFFPFVRFTLQQGQVALTQDSPLFPTLNIEGSGRLYGYDLTINIEGTADDPQITFSSSPHLESSEILLMVTTGQIPQSTEQRSTSGRLGSLGLFLGSGFIKDITGNKSSLADQMDITIGEDISETGRDTINIEYKVSDRFDAYNIDLKWQLYAN